MSTGSGRTWISGHLRPSLVSTAQMMAEESWLFMIDCIMHQMPWSATSDDGNFICK